jgi:hypothetical protein
MKLRTALYSALSVLSLWTSTATAQGESRLAVKLTPAAQDRQKADAKFIAGLLQKDQRTSFAATKLSVGSLVDPKRTADIAGRLRTAKLAAGFQVPNFDNWYQLKIGSGDANQPRSVNTTYALPSDVLNLIHALSKLPEVESVHALQPGPPPAVNPNDDPRSTNQGYLNAAPQGINARYAWGFAGGDGAGANIVDVEQGWDLNHEDLVGSVST